MLFTRFLGSATYLSAPSNIWETSSSVRSPAFLFGNVPSFFFISASARRPNGRPPAFRAIFASTQSKSAFEPLGGGAPLETLGVAFAISGSPLPYDPLDFPRYKEWRKVHHFLLLRRIGSY